MNGKTWLFLFFVIFSSTPAISSEPTMADQLLDFILWDRLVHGRTEMYISSDQWRKHCDGFHSSEMKNKCEDKFIEAKAGEEELQSIIHSFKLDEKARQQGWLTWNIRAGLLKEDQPLDETVEIWSSALNKLMTGYNPKEGYGCGQEHSCVIVFKLEKTDLKLMDIDLISLKSDKQEKTK